MSTLLLLHVQVSDKIWVLQTPAKPSLADTLMAAAGRLSPFDDAADLRAAPEDLSAPVTAAATLMPCKTVRSRNEEDLHFHICRSEQCLRGNFSCMRAIPSSCVG